MIEIIQALHDSEINGGIEWFYDGAWRWKLGDGLNGWLAEGNALTLPDAVRDLRDAATKHFPDSEFARARRG